MGFCYFGVLRFFGAQLRILAFRKLRGACYVIGGGRATAHTGTSTVSTSRPILHLYLRGRQSDPMLRQHHYRPLCRFHALHSNMDGNRTRPSFGMHRPSGAMLSIADAWPKQFSLTGRFFKVLLLPLVSENQFLASVSNIELREMLA